MRRENISPSPCGLPLCPGFASFQARPASRRIEGIRKDRRKIQDYSGKKEVEKGRPFFVTRSEAITGADAQDCTKGRAEGTPKLYQHTTGDGGGLVGRLVQSVTT